MMTKSGRRAEQRPRTQIDEAPHLKITKLGIVSRDYRHKYKNGYRDFSHSLCDVLKYLDGEGCDAALFSLFSIVPRKSYDPLTCFEKLRSVRAVFLEEFQDGRKREVKRYVTHHRTTKGWQEYELCQKFATLTGTKENDIANFVKDELARRLLGNCCVILCGESNGVKYSRNGIHDTFGLMKAIHRNVNIILNPIHDRMTRFEMERKRKYLSKNGRWVVSVWNKGKRHKDGKVRDGSGPAWSVFHNGRKRRDVSPANKFGVEIGILDFGKA